LTSWRMRSTAAARMALREDAGDFPVEGRVEGGHALFPVKGVFLLGNEAPEVFDLLGGGHPGGQAGRFALDGAPRHEDVDDLFDALAFQFLQEDVGGHGVSPLVPQGVKAFASFRGEAAPLEAGLFGVPAVVEFPQDAPDRGLAEGEPPVFKGLADGAGPTGVVASERIARIKNSCSLGPDSKATPPGQFCSSMMSHEYPNP
jgi:hypothetical protein